MALTPDGDPKKVLTDPQTIGACWITPTQYPNLVKYGADPTLSPFLDAYIIEACAMVNDICKRKFNKQQADMIVPNTNLYIGSYRNISLENTPLVSVDDIWINVLDTFAEVSLDYMQLDISSGLLKILPNFTTYVQTTLPYFQFGSAANIWIRYTSGYEIDRTTDPEEPINKVPATVQRATALCVDYLMGLDGLVPNVSEFKTQTYSQKSSNSKEDPIMSRIKEMLRDYMHFTIV
jgi:hypothetical protein